MIQNIKKGSGFAGVIRYLWYGSAKEPRDPAHVQLIGGNMAGRNPEELPAEFRMVAAFRNSVKNPVFHVSLAVHHDEHLSDAQWRALAGEYLDRMGFGHSQWIMVRHTDEDHDHVHIVANRVAMDGSLVSDAMDYDRGAKIVQEFEQRLGLKKGVMTPSQAANKLVRGPRGMYHWAKRNRKKTEKMKFQELIIEAAKGKPTLPEFKQRLLAKGMILKANIAKTGHVSGVSYGMDGNWFKGSQLGKAFTWLGLQKNFGIAYNPATDLAVLQAVQTFHAKAQTPIKRMVPDIKRVLAALGARKPAAIFKPIPTLNPMEAMAKSLFAFRNRLKSEVEEEKKHGEKRR